MNTKLTLTIEDSVIEKAKTYAKSKERSLSDLIENYLRALTKGSNSNKSISELTPTVKSLKGAFKSPQSFDYKKELSQILSEKHL